MKKSKVFILALTFVFAGSLASFANNNPTTNTDEIRKEIKTLVNDIDVTDMDNTAETVKVQFIVNNDNEVVVLNVSDKDFESAIKYRLNYKKLKTDETIKNMIYSVPITFKKA